MSEANWAPEFDSLKVQKRAKGRDRYNAQRGGAALHRRCNAWKLAANVGYPFRRGWQSELARRLGVHRSTICRDFAPFKAVGMSWCALITRFEEEGRWLFAELARIRYGQEIRKLEAYRRLDWRLNRRRRLGLPW